MEQRQIVDILWPDGSSLTQQIINKVSMMNEEGCPKEALRFCLDEIAYSSARLKTISGQIEKLKGAIKRIRELSPQSGVPLKKAVRHWRMIVEMLLRYEEEKVFHVNLIRGLRQQVSIIVCYNQELWKNCAEA